MKCQVAVVAIVKNEASYLDEWLCFHMAMGVDHFFIYDNSSEDNTREVLQTYINAGRVTLVWWPHRGGQLSAYLHALNVYGPLCEWMGWIDVDEFVNLLADDALPTYLRRFDDREMVVIPWQNFAFSGHRTRPTGFVIENFTLTLPDRYPDDVLTKCFFRPAAVTYVDVHRPFVRQDRAVRENGDPAPLGVPYPRVAASLAQINHYYTKSYEEFAKKIARGQASGGRGKTLLPFEAFRAYDQPDTSIHRHLPAFSAFHARYAARNASPFRYGREAFWNVASGVQNIPFKSTRTFFDPFDWYALRALVNIMDGVANLNDLWRLVPNIGGPNAVLIRSDQPVPTADVLQESPHFRHFLESVCGQALWTGGTIRPAGATLQPQAELQWKGDGEPGSLRSYCLCFVVRAPVDCSIETEWAALDATLRRSIRLPAPGVYFGAVEAEPRNSLQIKNFAIRFPAGIEIFDACVVAFD